MTNDTFCDVPFSNSISPPMIYIALIALHFHISNITTILVHQKFHQNVYFLLLNLSVSDAVCILFFLLMPAGVSPIIYMATIRAFFTVSILFTCSITADRYLKVGYDFIHSIISVYLRNKDEFFWLTFFLYALKLPDDGRGFCNGKWWFI